MSTYRLRLLDETNQDLVELELHSPKERIPNARLMFLPEQRVYSTRSYSGQLIGPKTQEIVSFELQINGYSAECSYRPHTGNIYFSDPLNEERVFANSFGLSSVWLRFRTRQGTQTLVSEYFQVMVRPGPDNYSVNAMGRYTASHYRTLLYQKQSLHPAPSFASGALHASLEEKIRYFLDLYQSMQQFLPDLERAAKTRQSALQSSRSFLPHLRRMVDYGQAGRMARNRQTRLEAAAARSSCALADPLYENQIILSFLYSVVRELGTLVESVRMLSTSLPYGMETRGSYVSSSSYMTRATALTLDEMAKDLKDLQDQFGQMLKVYRLRLHAREGLLHHLPAPSAAFLHIPVYQRVYALMRQWFSLRSINGEDLHFIRTFLQITTLYEVYILCKLLHFLEDWGFELKTSSRLHYELDHDAFYKNTEINNVFLLEKDDIKATVYYQPLIPDETKKSPCGLYRSISLSYPRSWSEPSRGRYYTPDYVIRLESCRWKGARYILADAKYATWQEVVDYKIIPLSYKYLFSLAPACRQDVISGLYIFHGKRESGQEASDLLFSAYDLMENPHTRFPQVEILSFYEYAGTLQQEQFEALRQILEIQLDRPSLQKESLEENRDPDLQPGGKGEASLAVSMKTEDGKSL